MRVTITSSGYDPERPDAPPVGDSAPPSDAGPGPKRATRCADHIASDDHLSYLAWHAKSERSQEQGLKQMQCDECKRWQWPWEMVGQAMSGAHAPAPSRAATQAERDAAVLEAVRSWRQQGQVGIPTPKGLAILVSVLNPGPAFASLDGRAVSASLARLKSQGKVRNGPGTLGWEACAPTEAHR